MFNNLLYFSKQQLHILKLIVIFFKDPKPTINARIKTTKHWKGVEARWIFKQFLTDWFINYKQTRWEMKMVKKCPHQNVSRMSGHLFVINVGVELAAVLLFVTTQNELVLNFNEYNYFVASSRSYCSLLKLKIDSHKMWN